MILGQACEVGMYAGESKKRNPFWFMRTPDETLSQYRLSSLKHGWLLRSILRGGEVLLILWILCSDAPALGDPGSVVKFYLSI